MIDVNIEFIKGVLVVTLDGKLNNLSVSSVRDNLLSIIKNGGIKYLMFNITGCILEENIDMFDKCNKLIKKNKGKMYVCGLRNKSLRLINDIYYPINNIESGLSIFKELNEC